MWLSALRASFSPKKFTKRITVPSRSHFRTTRSPRGNNNEHSHFAAQNNRLWSHLFGSARLKFPERKTTVGRQAVAGTLYSYKWTHFSTSPRTSKLFEKGRRHRRPLPMSFFLFMFSSFSWYIFLVLIKFFYSLPLLKWLFYWHRASITSVSLN